MSNYIKRKKKHLISVCMKNQNNVTPKWNLFFLNDKNTMLVGGKLIFKNGNKFKIYHIFVWLGFFSHWFQNNWGKIQK